MSFITIPDNMNVPRLIQLNKIKFITPLDETTLELNFGEGDVILTNMPRQILVEMLQRQEQKPIPVQPSTEFAG